MKSLLFVFALDPSPSPRYVVFNNKKLLQDNLSYGTNLKSFNTAAIQAELTKRWQQSGSKIIPETKLCRYRECSSVGILISSLVKFLLLYGI